jgi:hypothetical protein
MKGVFLEAGAAVNRVWGIRLIAERVMDDLLDSLLLARKVELITVLASGDRSVDWRPFPTSHYIQLIHMLQVVDGQLSSSPDATTFSCLPVLGKSDHGLLVAADRNVAPC